MFTYYVHNEACKFHLLHKNFDSVACSNTAPIFYSANMPSVNSPSKYVYIGVQLCRTVDYQTTVFFAASQSCVKMSRLISLAKFSQKPTLRHRFLNVEQRRTAIWELLSSAMIHCLEWSESKPKYLNSMDRVKDFRCNVNNNVSPKVNHVHQL